MRHMLNCDGYKALWAAVLVRAFEDALAPRTTVGGVTWPSPREKQTAEQFFNIRRKDFLVVCAFADVDPEYILRKYAEARKAQDGSI